MVIVKLALVRDFLELEFNYAKEKRPMFFAFIQMKKVVECYNNIRNYPTTVIVYIYFIL
jgi:hypothetical protein